MPSSTKKQAEFFSAIAHGMRPRKGGPSVKVAKEFLKADEQKGEFEHSRTPHSASSWKSGVAFRG